MENAFTWLSELWQFVVGLLPHFHRHELTDICVTITWGRFVKVRTPGVFLYWPPITAVYYRPANIQTHISSPLTLLTSDRESISVRAMVRFTIEDAVKAMIDTDDVESAIEDESEAALAEFVTSRTLDELLGARRKVNTSLTTQVRTQLRRYGVKVDRAQLTDSGTSMTLHHITANSMTVQPEE